MPIETIEVREKIIKSISGNDGLGIVPIFSYVPFSKIGYRILGESISIKNLEIRSFIYSLPVVEYPSFPIEASDSEIQLGALNFEWNSPRYHLETLLSTDGATWLKIGVSSILNPSPSPYGEIPLGDFDLGNTSMLGFRNQNVGFGILSGGDYIAVTADLSRVVTLEKISEGYPFTKELTADTSQEVIFQNSERLGFTLFNASKTETIYIDITSDVSLTSYMTRLQPKGYYESTPFNHTSSIYAISEGTATLLIREFV
jgi:hypothetical protein